MKILFTGKPNKGSWQIRAVQMAEGLGQCVPFATVHQCREADFIVVVKRTPPEVLRSVRASGRPWAWDAVDPYPQPLCSTWSRKQAIFWVREQVLELRPTVVCWANKKMSQDIDMEGVVIPHHHRPGTPCNPVRDRITLVGYEGSPKYLAEWAPALHMAAERIGAKFTDSPASLAECDVVVAVRGGPADCYATRQWKSNVKLANAHGSGTPFIGQKDPGYQETRAGGEIWVAKPDDLGPALETLALQKDRQKISENFRASAITLQDCQKQWSDLARLYS